MKNISSSYLKGLVLNLFLAAVLLISNAVAAQSSGSEKKQLIIAVTFTVPLENRAEFKSQLTSIFKTIKKQENTFVSYTVSEEIGKPGTILLYEIWNTDLEAFGKGPSGKPYFKPFVKALEDLNIKREPHLYNLF